MPSATTPATVAATAATAGTVRVRWRAASRAAYLAVSGIRPETRAIAVTTTGTTRIMPSTETIAAPAIQKAPLPLSEVTAPYADAATPMPTSTRPTTGVDARGRRSPRRPASTATTSWRLASQAGTTDARTAETTPKAVIAAR